MQQWQYNDQENNTSLNYQNPTQTFCYNPNTIQNLMSNNIFNNEFSQIVRPPYTSQSNFYGRFNPQENRNTFCSNNFDTPMQQPKPPCPCCGMSNPANHVVSGGITYCPNLMQNAYNQQFETQSNYSYPAPMRNEIMYGSATNDFFTNPYSLQRSMYPNRMQAPSMLLVPCEQRPISSVHSSVFNNQICNWCGRQVRAIPSEPLTVCTQCLKEIASKSSVTSPFMKGMCIIDCNNVAQV